jgi:pimeloyl-ACP methyl ester carboxylesterase
VSTKPSFFFRGKKIGVLVKKKTQGNELQIIRNDLERDLRTSATEIHCNGAEIHSRQKVKMLAKCSAVLLLAFALLCPCSGSSVQTNSNMDTQAEILDYCANPSSQWERYVCSKIGEADSWSKCWPQRRYSRCKTTVGVVALFHGYSACPDAYNELASSFQDKCLQVYSFLNPGHGHPLLSSNGTHADPNLVNRFNLTGLPNSRQPYIDFANQANSIITEERAVLKRTNEIRVTAVLGLSLGAPMATAAALQSDGLYSHLLLMSPFFGVSSDALDQPVADVDKCLQVQYTIHSLYSLYALYTHWL